MEELIFRILQYLSSGMFLYVLIFFSNGPVCIRNFYLFCLLPIRS